MSETDRQEAEQLGRLAVRAAVSGESFRMVTLNREPGRPYQAIYELVRLEDVAEKDNCLPLSYVTETENDIREEFLDYILPLIGTLPKYTVLHRKYI